MKRFKTSHFAKSMTKSLQKNKSFAFSSTKCFQTKELWLSFVSKVFDFISRAKFLLKFNLALKEKGISSDLLNKNHREKIFVCDLTKIWQKENELTSFKRKCYCC